MKPGTKPLKVLLSLLILITGVGAAGLMLSLGLAAVPRETCDWQGGSFCSDYRTHYLVISCMLALSTLLGLWALNRRREK